MGVRHRPMRPEDVAECAEIVAANPVIGPRYGRAIADLPHAWLRLLDCEAMRTNVFRMGNGFHAPICFVGVSLFVSDDFVRELKAPPGVWIGPELVKRILHRTSPILSDTQLREANSLGGLNLVVWEGCARSGFETNNEVYRHVMNTFIEEHKGFLLKEVIGPQLESVERFLWTIESGGLLWNMEAGRYEKSYKMNPKEIIRKPHFVGVVREMESERSKLCAGSWIGALFDYHPPQIGFSRGEQRLLLAALLGKTDAELADDLGTSISTVKNTWRSIYNRLASCQPEIFLDPSHTDAQHSDRGREKRRQLLAYLHQHPEELRPVSQKLLRHATSQPRRRSA